MSYLIAVASSDDVNVDVTFGAADGFSIYEVEGTSYERKEFRKTPDRENTGSSHSADKKTGDIGITSCGSEDGDGACSGGGTGCGHGVEISDKVVLLSDCRSIVCKKIGFKAQKQLEKRQVTCFDVACSVEDALNKISAYYDRIDNHRPLGNK